MRFGLPRRGDPSHRVTSGAGLRVRPAGTIDALRFVLAAGDDEAQSHLGWLSSELLPADTKPRARRLARGTDSGPLFHVPDGGTLLAAFIGDDYVGGAQLSPSVDSEYTAVGGADAWSIGGAVVASLRGRGIGTSMFAAAAAYAHRELGVQRLVAGCSTDNTASRRALMSAGFEQVVGPRQYALPDGRVVPSLWLVRSW